MHMSFVSFLKLTISAIVILLRNEEVRAESFNKDRRTRSTNRICYAFLPTFPYFLRMFALVIITSDANWSW